ncbi:MAG: RnfABCDGE type electron transport complex subunit G [Clostridia bacterium]|nr:RnfABCDGE type electron transport complex subunit G [Clostridia bacterium]
MKNAKEIIRVGLILFVITALSALLLAFVNKKTAPLIEENNRIKTENSMRTVLSDAESFEKLDFEGEGVVEAYAAKSGSDIVGVCVVTEANGYGGAIRVVTGVSADNKVTGIDILSHSETPGLGANATGDSFKSQYAGKAAGIGVSKGTAKDNEINAMSGATITSKAVTAAVNTALEAAGEILKEAK